MSGPANSLTLGVVTDVGEVASLLATVFKAGDDIFNALNTPAMIAARKSAAVQAALEKMDRDLLEAQKTGDISIIDKEASG